MPIIKSAKKAARQADKHTAHNQQSKKDIREAIKAFKKTPTGEALRKAQSEIDKAVKKDLIKKNTASRRKAALAKIAKAAKVVEAEAAKVEKKATAAAKKPAAKKATTTKKPAAKKTSPKSKAETK